jgi:hypothetical protein
VSTVCGAIVMIRLGPTSLDSCSRAEAMNVGLTPFSRSMSTPSNPYWLRIECTLLANSDALAASLTLTVPFCPPTDRMTFWPRACSVLMSAMNWAWV